jgi:arylformamidase
MPGEVPRVKLYREFASQDEIDREYNAGAAVAESAALTASWTERSMATRDRLGGRISVPYGPTRAERVDIFPAGEGAPVHIFIHGGYWRRFAAADFSFVAEALVAAGTTAVIVDYALCPGVSIDEIVRQVRAAIAWTWTNASTFGGARDRITLSGHSAGGHLTAMALATDWPGQYDLPSDVIKAGLAISGLFDLAPFPYSWLQPSLQLTWDQVLRQSPIRLVRAASPPLTVAVGADDSSEFRRQSSEFHQLREERGLPGRHVEVPGCNHFTVLTALAARQSGLAAEVAA